MSGVWNLSGQQAHLSHRGLTATIDLSHPELGLQSVQVDGHFWPEARLLGVDVFPANEAARSLAEVWIRDGDLVVVYEQVPARPYRVQVYWRAPATPEGLAGRAVDLQVSVQTDLLDVAPGITTRSRLCAGELGIYGSGGAWLPLSGSARRQADQQPCWLACRSDGGGAYAEMVHPADAQHDECRFAPAETTLEHQLFQRDLEKGVILRARLRGLLLPAADAAAQTLAWYDALIDAPLPLTT